MQSCDEVIETQLVARTQSEQSSRRRVRPDAVVPQTARPEAELARACRELHQLLVFLQRGLHAPATSGLEKKRNDHRALQEDDRERAGDVPAVLLPDRQRSE